MVGSEMTLIERKCPFYGFYMGPNILLNSKGNQCALIINSYSPCRMEYGNKKPDWETCPIIESKSRIEEIMANFKVFPEEVKVGISFDTWKSQIMNISPQQL